MTYNILDKLIYKYILILNNNKMSNPLKEISTTLSEFFKTICEQQVSNIIISFINKLVADANTDLTHAELTNIWNRVCPEYAITETVTTKSGKPLTTIQGSICCYYFSRAKRACVKEVSIKSVTKKYCTAHLKSETKQEKKEPDSSDIKKCCYIINSKAEKGKVSKQCTSNVSSKSVTQNYCSSHIKSGEKSSEPKVKKTKKVVEDVIAVKFSPKLNRELKVYVDSSTGFVVNRDDKFIYARIRDNKITQLTEEDKIYLTDITYKFDENLFIIKHPDLILDADDEEEKEEEEEVEVEEEEVEEEVKDKEVKNDAISDEEEELEEEVKDKEVKNDAISDEEEELEEEEEEELEEDEEEEEEE
jgi:hypothetical protein